MRDFVIQWAKNRNIIPYSNPMAQAIKTLEEVAELISALNIDDAVAAKDAYGDIMVTLIIGSELAGINLSEALEAAYNEIKDRKGYLREDGIFVKQE